MKMNVGIHVGQMKRVFLKGIGHYPNGGSLFDEKSLTMYSMENKIFLQFKVIKKMQPVVAEISDLEGSSYNRVKNYDKIF
ncbi:MAG TPA: hypothetical protein VK469_20215 [Candidatus Kapabacteria bacterium]|nr:hypothetical protein [Candidatus Kapabacteria bacterium]